MPRKCSWCEAPAEPFSVFCAEHGETWQVTHNMPETCSDCAIALLFGSESPDGEQAA